MKVIDGESPIAGNNFPGIASQFAMHFDMTAIQDMFCVAGFLHRSVQNLVWNICLWTESANQIRRGKLFPAIVFFGGQLLVVSFSTQTTCIYSS